MKTPSGFKTRLDPKDEYCHTPESVDNYNESMYFNLFDFEKKVGGWFRLGNRANEGYAEMTICLYLPDGRIAFMYKKPEIANNDEMKAGGLHFEVIEPLKKLRVSYEGKALVMADPSQMIDPSKAFRSNPSERVKVDLLFDGISPVAGGETVHEDGSPLKLDGEKSFGRAHYEQHMAGSGSISIGDEQWDISGYGLRDKSWGPRYWQAIKWYRWLPMSFGDDFGMMISLVCIGGDDVRMSGMVLEDGVYHSIEFAEIDTVWDDNYYQQSFSARCRTDTGKSYEIEANVMSLIPLRNRRQSPDGEWMHTRITEGMTEYRCNGRTGYGLSEYLDQIVDEVPVGISDKEK